MREGWNETKVLPRMSVETTKTTKDQERERVKPPTAVWG